ncbi:hypothetical protein V2A60_007325 [Cordyceps javanica]|uniref:Uncharacterized protein n=1 Tax=Cordyceps javanica TaxID=43265 RepID=A0A545VB97_9HYPO|nr:hypothetical protein IF1G_03063 [Cordyceps javanica]TQW10193.1 hypothetical protein IF2G_02983 [Cordyceps javanica]
MASSKRRIPTYHVVPHFNIAATGGALRLGTVVTDLDELVPLNKNVADFVPVPAEDVYSSTTQTGFHASRSQVLSGQFGVWAEALGLSGVGGHANAGAERNREETVSCASVVTTFFDPDPDWVDACLAARPINNYMVASSYAAAVYLVTGLKVATNLTFGSEATKSAGADAKAGASVPDAPVQVGLEGDFKSERMQALGFQSSDIIVGFRVRKYRYKKKSLFGKERKLEGQTVLHGAEMLDDKPGPKKLLAFEEIPIQEEILAQEKAENAEATVEECWVKSYSS